MKFEKIIIKNFRSIGKKEFTYEFQEGITTVKGKNGQGKSTFLEAIFFVFTGKSYKGSKKASLVNDIIKKNTEVEIYLTKNSKKYIIKRTISPDDVSLLIDGEDQHFTDKKDFQNKIENIFGINERILKQIIFLSQKYFVPYFSLTPSEKRDFRDRIFNLDIIKNMEQLIKEDIIILKSEISQLEVECEKKKFEIEQLKNNNEKNINEKREKISLLNQNIVSYAKELKIIKNELNNLSFDKDKIKQLQNDIKEKEKNLNLFETNKQIATNRNETINKTIEKNKKLQDKKENLENELKEITKLYVSPDKFDVTEKDIELKKLLDNMTEFYQKIQINEIKEKELNEKIDFYNKNDICSQCGTKLTPETKKEHIDEIQSQIDKVIKETESIWKKHKIIKNNYDELFKEISDIEFKEKENNKLKNEIDNKTNELENINDILSGLDCSDEKLEENNSIILESTEHITRLNSVIQKLNNELNDLEKKEEQYDNLITLKNTSINKINVYREEVENYKIELEELKGKIFEKQTKELEDLEKDKNRSLLKLKYMTMVYETTHDKRGKQYILDDYKKYIVEMATPLLNSYIQNYTEILNFEYKILVSNGCLDIEIRKRNKIKDYIDFSDGEQQQINMIILFSFIELMMTMNGIDFPLLILDEVTAALDMDNTETFYKILKEKFSNLNVIVITHKLLEQVSEYVDRKIHVQRNIYNFSEYYIEN
jgi:DNA repair exonuclease SbcCD ATPase subunit